MKGENIYDVDVSIKLNISTVKKKHYRTKITNRV